MSVEDMIPLIQAAKRYPTCSIANCECNEFADEWRPGCGCMGHFTAMNNAFGDGARDWSLADFSASVPAGEPTRAPAIIPPVIPATA